MMVVGLLVTEAVIRTQSALRQATRTLRNVSRLLKASKQKHLDVLFFFPRPRNAFMLPSLKCPNCDKNNPEFSSCELPLKRER